MWSRDGVHVVYNSLRQGRWRIYRRLATAVGAEEVLLDANGPVTPLQTLPSAHIVYAARGARLPFDVWKLADGRSTPLVHIGGFYPGDAQLSRDERWLAYVTPESSGQVGKQTVYVSGAPFSENRRAIAEGASMPRWRADGKELFYLAKDSSVVAVPVNPQRTPSEARGTALFRTAAFPLSGITGQIYDAGPDGRRFLLKREVGSSPIHLILNWGAHSGVSHNPARHPDAMPSPLARLPFLRPAF